MISDFTLKSPPQTLYSIGPYHHGEYDGGGGRLDDPQQYETGELCDGEQVNFPQRNMPKVDEIWLMFCRHAEQLQTVEELKQSEKEDWVRKYVTSEGKINQSINDEEISCLLSSRARVCVKRNICT